MQPEIVGRPVPMYAPIQVADGDVLRFRGLKWGCRSYIAFSGGLDVPEVMGSRSTYIRAKIGGYKGRSLREGDIIPLGEETETHRISSADAFIKSHYRNREHSYRAICSRAESGSLPIGSQQGGFCRDKNLSYNLNIKLRLKRRMGLRLSGEPIKVTDMPEFPASRS